MKRGSTVKLAVAFVAIATQSMSAGIPNTSTHTYLPSHNDVHLAAEVTMADLNTDAEKAVYQLIEDLIQAGTTFDTSELERIYHDDMTVTMIDLNNNMMKASKSDFVGLFENMLASGKEPLNTQANYNDVTVDGNTASVLITRNVNLTGADQILVLNIDLIFEDDRWQVTREMIFARPDDAS